MNKIEKWAALFASLCLAIILFFVAPVVYPIMAKVVDYPDLTNRGDFFNSAKETVTGLPYLNDMKEVEEDAPKPKGILYVTSKNVNIRSSAAVKDHNLIGESKKGEYLLYFETEKVDGTVWYLIQQRDDLEGGWISGKTVKEIASASSVLDDQEHERVSDFMNDYAEATIESIIDEDFTLVAHYLDQKGPVYKEQKNYLAYLNEKQITEELLAYKVINTLRINDHMLWARTIEFYDITHSDGNVERKDFISEYLITVTDQEEFKVNRLLGTYQVN